MFGQTIQDVSVTADNTYRIVRTMQWFEIAKRRMKELSITQDAAAVWMGVTRGGMGHYLAGRREPSIEQLKELAKNLQMPLSSLLGEQRASYLSDEDVMTLARQMNIDDGDLDPMRARDLLAPRLKMLEGQLSSPGDNVGTPRSGAFLVPVISWVQAGAWSDIVDNFQPGDADHWRPAAPGAGPRSFFLRVEGESMYNPSGKHSYRPGELICVDPDRHAQNTDRVIVRLERIKKTTFKQLVIEDDQMYLKALNPDWPEKIIVVNEEATICGVVVGRWIDE